MNSRQVERTLFLLLLGCGFCLLIHSYYQLFSGTSQPVTLANPQPAAPRVFPVYRVERVVDGDSGWLVLDLGLDTLRRVNYRLQGVDTPESRGESREQGQAVRRWVEHWMTDVRQAEGLEVDKYGRTLLILRNAGGQSLAEELIRRQMGRPYTGGARLPWTADELQRAATAAQEDG